MVSVFEISDLGIWSSSVYLIKDVYHPVTGTFPAGFFPAVFSPLGLFPAGFFPAGIFPAKKTQCGRQFWNAVEREPVETRVLNPTASEAS